MNRIMTLAAVMTLGLTPAFMQAQPQERGDRRDVPPGDAILGKVTSVGKDSLVLSPLMGGDPVTVNITDTTRIMKDRQPVKLTDIKTDDVVFVRGQMNTGVLSAVVVGVLNPEMAQRIQPGGMIRFGMGRGNGGGAGFGGGAGTFNREDLGKKFIAGEVKAINETKLTIARPDGQSQDIEVDENTSFKRGNESITLPDIKVGDFVRGAGELKDNVFVPRELVVGRPQIRMMIAEPQGNAPADKPSTPAPPKN